MDKIIKMIPLIILAILLIIFIVFRDSMSVMIVAVMCGLCVISIMSAIYTAKIKAGKSINPIKYLILSLVIAVIMSLGVYYGVAQLYK